MILKRCSKGYSALSEGDLCTPARNDNMTYKNKNLAQSSLAKSTIASSPRILFSVSLPSLPGVRCNKNLIMVNNFFFSRSRMRTPRRLKIDILRAPALFGPQPMLSVAYNRFDGCHLGHRPSPHRPATFQTGCK